LIVFLTNEFPCYAGGVATYSYELAKAIAAQGVAIMVLAAQKHPDDLAFDRAQQFPIVRVPENRSALKRHWNRFSALHNRIRKSHPLLLWASDWRAGISVSMAAHNFKIPYVVTAHGTEVLIARERFYRKRIALHVFRHAQLVLSDSDYTRRLLTDLGVADNKIKVTPLGIDPDHFLPDPVGVSNLVRRHDLEGKKVILTLARLTPRKGQDVMIRALPKVLEAVPSAVYVIAGSGEDEQRLRKLVADLGLETHVIFAGYVDDTEKAAYYHVCDLYVMLSRQEGHFVEGFGLTLLEAGVCAKPVVAGQHGGVPESVVEGQTGLLVDPRSTEEVAAAVIRVLSDEQFARKMGDNARRRILQEKTWSHTAKIVIEAFQGITRI